MSIASTTSTLLTRYLATVSRCMGLSIALLLVIAVTGCDRTERLPPPQLSGTFTGATADGRALTISLAQDQNTVIGAGRLADQLFSLSAITAPQGPAVIIAAGGAQSSGSIALAPAGDSVTLYGLGEPVELARGGTPLPVTAGAFAGRYKARHPQRIWLQLEQSGELLAGTGFLWGRPVAVAGWVTGPREARGSLLLSDQSRNGVRVTLSADLSTLSVSGLGGTIQMQRQ
jgi:hypothetical protein